MTQSAFLAVAQHVGEVVESATESLLAQAYAIDDAPRLGSLVRIPFGRASDGSAGCTYGVVTRAHTAPVDPGRAPVARGQSATSLDDIYREHPQLERLFRTLFAVRVVGHGAVDGAIVHYLPEKPPEVHQLVFACDNHELERFTERPGYLALLLADRGPIADEVTAAFLREAARVRGIAGQPYLVHAGKAMVSLLRGDSVRLATLLGRLG
ncbi:MAG: hypothetical protein EXR52_08125 [Dehalococcoidia bacterium]|nr:hypothetical protein [Dehalococcoidia bacterium]